MILGDIMEEISKPLPTKRKHPIPLREELEANPTIERKVVLNYTILQTERLAHHFIVNNVGSFETEKEINGSRYKITIEPIEGSNAIKPRDEKKQVQTEQS